MMLFMVLAGVSVACTTFLMEHQGHYYFGRNYDWVSGNGMLVVNNRYLQKASAHDPSLQWTSNFGSISFNQFGKEFPTGGMNEKGLVVELMWLDETQYPEADKRGAVNVLQWIQYQLDCSATIEDVIASDQLIRITSNDSPPLHYLIADASGNTATIEFLNGKMVVHKGKDLPYPVLSNSTYANSVRQADPQIKEGQTPSFDDNSIQRFAQVCTMLSQYRTTHTGKPVDNAFSILDHVSQGDYTKWRIVYDITGRQVHFTSSGAEGRKTLAMKSFSFNCQDPSYYLDLNHMATGSMDQKMLHLSPETNKKILEKSVQETKSRLSISPASIAIALDQFKAPNCDAGKK